LFTFNKLFFETSPPSSLTILVDAVRLLMKLLLDKHEVKANCVLASLLLMLLGDSSFSGFLIEISA
jgi:hypothetical protein